MIRSNRPLVLNARSCADYGDSPDFAVVHDIKDLMEKVVQLQSVITSHGLTEARVARSPDVWVEGVVATEHRLESLELVVTNTSTWFAARHRHGDHTIETENFTIQQLEELLAAGDGAVFASQYPDALKGSYEEYLAHGPLQMAKLDEYSGDLKVSDLYDSDSDFSALLNDLIPHFEYPDFSWMTIEQVKNHIAHN